MTCYANSNSVASERSACIDWDRFPTTKTLHIAIFVDFTGIIPLFDCLSLYSELTRLSIKILHVINKGKIVACQIGMNAELKVHPSFFREFATKTWVSPTDIVKELVENAFDEDATQVIVTLQDDGNLTIEDNAGMDNDDMEKFLLLGSPHKVNESISPKLKRIRTGRYGTGRLSFLTSFEKMKIRTKRNNFSLSALIDSSTVDRLFSGNATLETLSEQPLMRDGTELTLTNPKVPIDISRLYKELRKLAILRQPMFEVFIKSALNFNEWDFTGAQLIKAPDIQGHRIPVNLDNGKITGEIVISRRPLSEDEKGIAIMVGSHVVTRSSFDFDTKFKRVTGYIRCNSLTSRFADKSALIEDEEYDRFNQTMRTFIVDTVLPSLTDYEDVLITREESRIYKEIDKVLGQAIIENVEQDELEGYEMVQMKEIGPTENTETSSVNYMEELPARDTSAGSATTHNINQDGQATTEQTQAHNEIASLIQDDDLLLSEAKYASENQPEMVQEAGIFSPSEMEHRTPASGQQTYQTEVSSSTQVSGSQLKERRVRRPVLKKTFALKKVGYKVIPYEDESDSRYSFTNENVVFVNKANSTYRAEATRGDEFLLRHIIGIVAEAIAETKYPEGKDALELQNRLIAEAIRIHDYSVIKKV
jgi:Histidine kinase-, DNA gyrase B-, and HSP90-like ATPase